MVNFTPVHHNCSRGKLRNQRPHLLLLFLYDPLSLSLCPPRLLPLLLLLSALLCVSTFTFVLFFLIFSPLLFLVIFCRHICLWCLSLCEQQQQQQREGELKMVVVVLQVGTLYPYTYFYGTYRT